VLKNVTSVPGEMVVYEGASVIHGRPYPLPSGSLELPVGGDPTYMAVLYLHFEPVGYTLQHTLDRQAKDDGVAESLYDEMPTTTGAMDKASKVAFERALAVQQERMQQSKAQEFKGKMELRAKDEVPRYVWDNYRDMYQQRFVFQHEPAIYPKPSKVIFGQISAHQAAALGDLLALKSLAAKDRYLLFKADLNGWRPLHEAARSGYADIIEYLLEEGADVNARTNDGLGGTALYWAEKDPKKNHKAIAILKRYGGLNIPPEYKDD
jgi:Ankyrin repeats (3 copies)